MPYLIYRFLFQLLNLIHYNFKEISQLSIDNLALTNKIILSELIPSAMANKEYEFIDCLSGIGIVLLDIDWDGIIGIQYQCIKTGINKLGLLDIAIAQNVKQNNIKIFSTDKHMILLSKKMGINCKWSSPHKALIRAGKTSSNRRFATARTLCAICAKDGRERCQRAFA
ncbi:MAG: hypothetical protein LBK73_13100 [Treponema sp.]|jgi:hypothetical protein|nr:hypothetical protein [Treponema sp.]